MKKGDEEMFQIVKRYFDRGIYQKADIAVFVRSKAITPEEYEVITGESYTE